MTEPPALEVEFYGMARQRAGRPGLRVQADTVGELLAELERTCPGLAGLRNAAGGLTAHYLLSLEGTRFLTDTSERLPQGARVLLLSADAGG